MSQDGLPSAESTTEAVFRLFREHGDSRYGGEAITQREHALQAAMFAERENAPPALITAALLHDVGHLLHSLPDDTPEQGVDDRHEALAARWLERRFGRDVVEPAFLHVAAKRYLCATDPNYLAELSPPSVLSLGLQGGPMSPDEIHQFQAHLYHDAALALRRWDDQAKIPNLETPSLEHFVSYITQSIANSQCEKGT